MKFGEVDFEKMADRNRVIYKGLWEHCFTELEVEPTSGNTNTTYRLSGGIENAADIIKKCFRIENTEQFDKKYKMAISGNGEEENKILTMHSSSRCSLLAFYNLDKEHTITLTIDGKEVVFDCSVFEFKNPVIRFPSNMDVVLLSADRKAVLFLESKFSEYYIGASEKSSLISKSYLTHKYAEAFYDEAWLNSIGIRLDKGTDESKEFALVSMDGTQNYFDGFKQMISHYIGIRKRIDGKRIAADNSFENMEIADEILSIVADPEATVYLGEVLFDKFVLPAGSEGVLDPDEAYKNYSRMYRELACKMNEVNRDAGLGQKFIVLTDDLRYSDIFRAGTFIDPYVHDFYRM